MSWAARAQRERPDLLYERALFSQQTPLFKLASLQGRRLDVLIVGSSRVMQFREEAFPGLAFHNGGGMVNSVADLTMLRRVLADGRLARPKALVLGVDPWWLVAGQEPIVRFQEEALRDEAFDPVAHVAAARRAFGADLPWARATFGPLATGAGQAALGLLPLTGAGGWRNDGSWYYGDWAERLDRDPAYRDPHRRDHVADLEAGHGFFLAQTGLDGRRVLDLRREIGAIRSLGIELVLLVPPFSDALSDAFAREGRWSRWWREFGHLFGALRTEGLPLVEGGRPEVWGGNDTWMLDDIHPGEIFAARIASALAVSGAPTLARLDLVRLRRTLDEAQPGRVLLRP